MQPEIDSINQLRRRLDAMAAPQLRAEVARLLTQVEHLQARLDHAESLANQYFDIAQQSDAPDQITRTP